MSKPSTDREAVTLIIEGLREQGIKPLRVNYDPEDIVETTTTEEAVEAVMAVDMATVIFKMPEGSKRQNSFVWFVLGNDPEEVACDYGVSLSEFIDPIVEPWWVEAE